MVITQSNIDETQRLLGRIRQRLTDSRIIGSQYRGSAEPMSAIEMERVLSNTTNSLVDLFFAFETFLTRVEYDSRHHGRR
jgi:hypothetical protein